MSYFDDEPPDDAGDDDRFWNELVDALHISEDEFATNLLYDAWFDPEGDWESMLEMREAFFDYLGMDDYEFWEIWRELYG